MAEKLFYADAHLRKFTARVLSCEESGRLFAVTLDRTAFFPEGGGQSGDIGTLGGARVTDTREERGEILHFCDAPLVPGAEVTGELDWETRFARMQIHSAEHLVSGHAHALWGCGNVGFHMDEHGATIDFDRELDAPQLMRLERLVNEDVWKNLPINILWPAEEELAAMPFRQKKELSMPVRIVEVPGVDLCACCAPHVSFTGEIGLVRLKDRMRHRGGVRFTMLAGRAAYEDAALCAAETESLSRLFSAPQNALCAAAERVLGELEEEKYARAAAERRYVEARLAARKPCEGNLLFFELDVHLRRAPEPFARRAARSCRGRQDTLHGRLRRALRRGRGIPVRDGVGNDRPSRRGAKHQRRALRPGRRRAGHDPGKPSCFPRNG